MTSQDGPYHVTAADDGDDDGGDNGDNDGTDDGDNNGADDGDCDVDNCDAREDVWKEDATNTTITLEQDDILELYACLSDTADDTVHEYSA